MDPIKNLDALLIGTGEFSFSEGSTTVAEAILNGYRDFGNIKAFTPASEKTEVTHKGSYRGKLIVDKIVRTETTVSYTLQCEEWDVNKLRMLFFGELGSGNAQAAKAAADVDDLEFTVGTPAVAGRWYQLTDGGEALMHLTTVTIATLTEGTDFDVDLKLGRVKFAAAHTTTLTPTVTSSAITSSDATFMNSFAALADAAPVEGIGRLVCYDQNDDSIIAFDHREFKCTLTVESAGAIDGTNFSELQLKVTINADLPGTVFVRE
jgi:hypothetical protein